MHWYAYKNSLKLWETSSRLREISKSSKLPEGPAKEERWRRVLRTTGKNLFLMRRCAVKHQILMAIVSEIDGFNEISEFSKIFRIAIKLKIFAQTLKSCAWGLWRDLERISKEMNALTYELQWGNRKCIAIITRIHWNFEKLRRGYVKFQNLRNCPKGPPRRRDDGECFAPFQMHL